MKRLGSGIAWCFTGYLADEDLAVLLNLAAVLALPSLMEGFGLAGGGGGGVRMPGGGDHREPAAGAAGGRRHVFRSARGGGLEPALEAILRSEELRNAMGEAAGGGGGAAHLGGRGPPNARGDSQGSPGLECVP